VPLAFSLRPLLADGPGSIIARHWTAGKRVAQAPPVEPCCLFSLGESSMFELIVALSVTPPILAGLWMAEWWRSGRRNRKGECGGCRRPLAYTSEDQFLISGRLICAGCATRMKRRMPWMLGTLALVVVAAAGGAAVMAEGAEWVLGPLVTFPVAFGAVQLMKLANRRAQRRLAAGDLLRSVRHTTSGLSTVTCLRVGPRPKTTSQLFCTSGSFCQRRVLVS
jgi:hypothetical protein